MFKFSYKNIDYKLIHIFHLILPVLFILSSSIYNIRAIPKVFPTIIFMLLFYFTIYKNNKFDIKEILLLLLFFISVLISAGLQSDISILKDAIVILSIYLLAMSFEKEISSSEQRKLAFYGSVISFIVFIAFPFFFMSVGKHEYGGYTGIFNNSNTLGTILATFISLAAIYFLDLNELKSSKFKKIVLILYIFFSFYLIDLSTSRTSLISGLVIISIMAFSYFKNNKTKHNLTLIIIFILILTSILLKDQNMNISLFTNISQKFDAKSSDLSSGRFSLWSPILKNLKFFGNGNNLLNESINTHNTFIHIINSYGIIGLFLFTFIMFKILFNNSLLLSKSSHQLSLQSLIPFINFFIISMTESMMLSYPIILFVILTYNKDDQNLSLRQAQPSKT